MDKGLPRLLTRQELAGLLRLKLTTIDHWRSLGKGPPFLKIGGTVQYRESDVLTWLERQTRQANHPVLNAELRGIAAA